MRRSRSLLSSRELEVLILIANEYTTAMIAKKMHLSVHTIISHRKNLLSKLEVSNTAGLVRRGFEIGVLTIPTQHKMVIPTLV